MAIPISNYVQITSGVGGATAVGTRPLILRLFTTNPLVPPQADVTFTNPNDVATYFGSTSAEYLRANFYFGFLSKNITAPPSIMFSRWVNAAVGSYVYGIPALYAVSSFTGITNGGFTLTLGGVTQTLTGINLGGVSSLSGVAAAIQAAVRAAVPGNPAWANATVVYDSTRGNGAFELFSGSTGTDSFKIVAATSGQDLAQPLGWVLGAIFANGSAVETLTNNLIAATNRTNAFGRMAYIPTLSLAQHLEIATWNKAQNVLYAYSVPVNATNAATWSATLIQVGGTDMTLSPISTEYPELLPAAILAATNYNGVNSTQNFMYQTASGLTPSVTDLPTAQMYDALRVNYYGQTQTNGQLINFYQRGIMCGLSTDPVDMNTYSNEQWLKNAAGAAFINLLLALAKVSANTQGQGQLTGILRPVVRQAKRNGTISVGKPLNPLQQLYITNLSNDPKAWYQVQNTGFWYTVSVASYTNTQTGLVEWKGIYTLIYSKDDTLRAIQGTHVLI